MDPCYKLYREDTNVDGWGSNRANNATLPGLPSKYYGEASSCFDVDYLSAEISDDIAVDPSQERHMALPKYKTFHETSQFFLSINTSMIVSIPSSSSSTKSSASPLRSTVIPRTTELNDEEVEHTKFPMRKSLTDARNDFGETSNSWCEQPSQETRFILSTTADQLINYVNERVNLFRLNSSEDDLTDDQWASPERKKTSGGVAVAPASAEMVCADFHARHDQSTGCLNATSVKKDTATIGEPSEDDVSTSQTISCLNIGNCGGDVASVFEAARKKNSLFPKFLWKSRLYPRHGFDLSY